MTGYPESVLDRWNKWHAANPHIYVMFKSKAYHMRAMGHAKYSARRIVESMRWDSDMMGTANPFLINSDFVPIMARKFVKENPGTEGFFEFREVRSRGIKSKEEKKREAMA